MEKRQKRKLWLGVAGLLFALAALLMFTGQGEESRPEAPKVEFPRRMRAPERERAERRRTQVAPPPVDAGTAEKEPARPRDPLLAALPRGKGKTAVVIEANALRHSPIGALLLDCLMRDGGKQLDEFRKASGVDPLQDLDRLVVTDEGMMLSGNFENAKFKELLGERTSFDYGESARVYEPGDTTVPQKDGTTVRRRGGGSIGTWNNQLLVVGESPDEVKAAIDRVEGRGGDEPPLLTENSTYGEMYGVLSVEHIARLFPPEQAQLAERLRAVAQNVELHMDASSDVALVAEVTGANSSEVEDLGKSLGAALSLARLQAQAGGDKKDKDLAQLLDFAKVRPDGDSFTLEMAVPLSIIQERLAFCREGRKEEAAAQAPSEEPAPPAASDASTQGAAAAPSGE
ncbi:hypothetical protein LZ198_15820 [Myxococcus sp. K15C18031901]|uniref:hypothetical protein n=1 Tax=Myxococcus dinghuensis TaxID=2906761 RepID=UPI0020A7E3D7|nr:hypothetical protein [Myxococcus dinghuensis]MCP3100336.1 hypothetical protein [Myxococcus dinghuensis]